MRAVSMTEQAILSRLREGMKIRYVPRSISGLKADKSYDTDAEECDLFGGRYRLTSGTSMIVADLHRRKIVKFVRRGEISFVELTGRE